MGGGGRGVDGGCSFFLLRRLGMGGRKGVGGDGGRGEGGALTVHRDTFLLVSYYVLAMSISHSGGEPVFICIAKAVNEKGEGERVRRGARAIYHASKMEQKCFHVDRKNFGGEITYGKSRSMSGIDSSNLCNQSRHKRHYPS